MQSWSWKKWMKWIAGLLAAVAAAVAGYMASGCAQSVPVVVQQQTLHCETATEGSDGWTFSGCNLNGNQAADQGDTESDAEAEGEIPVQLELPDGEPTGLRLGRRPYRFACN
jgi:hypothetical protein